MAQKKRRRISRAAREEKEAMLNKESVDKVEAESGWAVGGFFAGAFIAYVVGIIALYTLGVFVLAFIVFWVALMTVYMKSGMVRKNSFRIGFTIGGLGIVFGFLGLYIMRSMEDKSGTPSSNSVVVATAINSILAIAVLFVIAALAAS